MDGHPTPNVKLLSLVVLGMLVLMACGGGAVEVAPEVPASEPTAQPTPAATARPTHTATATATPILPTLTPEPTATASPVPATPAPPTSTPTQPPPSPTPTPSVPLVAAVRLLGSNRFSPEQVEIGVGGTVTWRYEAGTHNVVGVNNQLINDAEIRTGSGQTYSVTFPAAGTYGFTCSVHPTTMNGTVVVR